PHNQWSSSSRILAVSLLVYEGARFRNRIGARNCFRGVKTSGVSEHSNEKRANEKPLSTDCERNGAKQKRGTGHAVPTDWFTLTTDAEKYAFFFSSFSGLLD
ncbi:unnamed protein product, partial [Heterotrigona itama]